ncbi:MAG: hypothetical protein RL211_1835, partial [Pseudomonadota bacterium]
MATSQVSAQARGYIVVLEGKAWVLDNFGRRVLLKVGDEVQEGQVLVTDNGTRLELGMPNGQVVSVSTGRELLVDANLLGIAPTDQSEAVLTDLNNSSAQIARIIQSGGDLSIELDPAGAGQTGGDASESHGFVRLLRIVESLGSVELNRADADAAREPIVERFQSRVETVTSTTSAAPVVASVTSDAQTEGTALVHTVTLSGASAAAATYSFSLSG